MIDRLSPRNCWFRQGDTFYINLVLWAKNGSNLDKNALLLATGLGIVKRVRFTTYHIGVLKKEGLDLDFFIEYVNYGLLKHFIRLLGKNAQIEVEDCDKDISIAGKITDFADTYDAKYLVEKLPRPTNNVPFILWFDFGDKENDPMEW